MSSVTGTLFTYPHQIIVDVLEIRIAVSVSSQNQGHEAQISILL